jgi:hypothetical protein
MQLSSPEKLRNFEADIENQEARKSVSPSVSEIDDIS